jgi:hypothetical protein
MPSPSYPLATSHNVGDTGITPDVNQIAANINDLNDLITTQWFHVKRYGAVCDDSTYDDDAIDDAIAAAIAAGGGTVVFPGMCKRANPTIVNDSQVRLMGMSWACGIHYDGSDVAVRFGDEANTAAVADNSIENMRVRGTSSADYGIDVMGSQRTWVKWCKVDGFTKAGAIGARFTGPDNSPYPTGPDCGMIGGFVTSCSNGIQTTKAAGASASYGASFVKLIGVRVSGYTETGIDIDYGEGILAEGVRCTTGENGTTGIRVNDAVSTWVGCTADNSYAGSDFTITNKALTSNVATITAPGHTFVVGQTVNVVGVDTTFNGTVVVTAVSGDDFSYAKTHADVASAADSGNATDRNNIGWDIASSSANGTIIIGPLGNMKPGGAVDTRVAGVADGNTRFVDGGTNTVVWRQGFGRTNTDENAITGKTNGASADINGGHVVRLGSNGISFVKISASDTTNKPYVVLGATTRVYEQGKEVPVAAPGKEVPVLCDTAAVAVGDTLICGGSTGTAKADNTATSAKLIIGVATSSKGVTGGFSTVNAIIT